MGEPVGAVLVFDGDCGFCSTAAGWIASTWAEQPSAIASQSLGADGLAELGLTTEQVGGAVCWVDGKGRVSEGHRAVGAALLASGGWFHLAGFMLLTRPIGRLAAPLYRLVALHRHRLPGATAGCGTRMAPRRLGNASPAGR